MQRLLTVVFALAVILAAVAFVAAPVFAFHALQSSADAQDVQGLSEVVDYDAVRASLKAELQGSASAAPPSFWQDPFGAVRSAIMPLKPDDRVEALLKPAALAALTRGHGWDAVKAQPQPAGASGEQTLPTLRFWGPNRCRLAVPAAQAGWGETLFTFERKGLFRWKLVHIAMPSRAGGVLQSAVAASPAA